MRDIHAEERRLMYRQVVAPRGVDLGAGTVRRIAWTRRFLWWAVADFSR